MTGSSNEDEVRRRYNLLPKEKYDSIILKDSKCSFQKSENCFEFSFENFNCGSGIIQNTYFSILQFYKEHQKKYDFYYFLEDDVIFNGEWRDFFDDDINNDKESDLKCVLYHINDINNNHWYCQPNNNFLGNYERKNNAGGAAYILRFSRKMLELMYNSTLRGYSSHVECFPFVLAVDNDFKISTFNENFIDHNFCNTSYITNMGEQHNWPKNKIIHRVKF